VFIWCYMVLHSTPPYRGRPLRSVKSMTCLRHLDDRSCTVKCVFMAVQRGDVITSDHDVITSCYVRYMWVLNVSCELCNVKMCSPVFMI
jgi:hypothetical protein